MRFELLVAPGLGSLPWRHWSQPSQPVLPHPPPTEEGRGDPFRQADRPWNDEEQPVTVVAE